MIMSHFMPTTVQPQSASDYLRTNMEVLAKDIHPMDKIELHKQTVRWCMPPWQTKHWITTNYKIALIIQPLSWNWREHHHKPRTTESRSLEDVIIEIGHDPKDVKGIQELLKLRDADMAALRKKIKLPATIHPQTDEVAQQRHEKDATTLLISLYKELIRTQDKLGESEAAKAALQAALKQKEEGQTSQPPPEIINLEEAAPTTTPPPQQTGPTAPTTSTTAPTTEQTHSLDMQKLQNEIQVLEAQMKELDEVKESLAKVNERYDKSKQNEAAKEREVKALKKRITELEKELTLEKVTAELKAVLWGNIGRSITNQWQYIETMDEQIVLITKANREIHRARASLGNMPDAASRMINILNNKTSSQLATMGITNRTETISMVKRVLTLRNLVGTLERRTQDMQTEINKFMDRFQALQNRGLPSILSSVGRLLTLKITSKGLMPMLQHKLQNSPVPQQNQGQHQGRICMIGWITCFLL
jgi:hypothetical protein